MGKSNEAVQVLKLVLIFFRAFRYSFVPIQTSSLLFTVSWQHLSLKGLIQSKSLWKNQKFHGIQ